MLPVLKIIKLILNVLRWPLIRRRIAILLRSAWAVCPSIFSWLSAHDHCLIGKITRVLVLKVRYCSKNGKECRSLFPPLEWWTQKVQQFQSNVPPMQCVFPLTWFCVCGFCLCKYPYWRYLYRVLLRAVSRREVYWHHSSCYHMRMKCSRPNKHTDIR